MALATKRGREEKAFSPSRQKLCGSRSAECLPDDLLVTLLIASHLVSGVHKAWPFASAGRGTNWPTSGAAGPPDTAEARSLPLPYGSGEDGIHL